MDAIFLEIICSKYECKCTKILAMENLNQTCRYFLSICLLVCLPAGPPTCLTADLSGHWSAHLPICKIILTLPFTLAYISYSNYTAYITVHLSKHFEMTDCWNITRNTDLLMGRHLIYAWVHFTLLGRSVNVICMDIYFHRWPLLSAYSTLVLLRSLQDWASCETECLNSHTSYVFGLMQLHHSSALPTELLAPVTEFYDCLIYVCLELSGLNYRIYLEIEGYNWELL